LRRDGLPPLEVDLATMTGNVAQVIVDQPDWDVVALICEAETLDELSSS